jgi:DNA-binding transcriptional LysR family regulator
MVRSGPSHHGSADVTLCARAIARARRKAWLFHRRVSAALREVALAEAELSDTSETLRGTLRIAGSAVFVAGKGIAVIPFYRVREAVEAGRAEIVLDDFTWAPTLANALWLSGPRTPSRVQRFVDLLARRLKKVVI